MVVEEVVLLVSNAVEDEVDPDFTEPLDDNPELWFLLNRLAAALEAVVDISISDTRR